MIKAGLNSAQIGIYTECLADPESTTYNIAFFQKLRDDIDTDKLAAAIERAVELHPALSSVIETEDGRPVLRAGAREIHAEIIEIGEAEEKKLPEGLVTPFDIEGGELARFKIFKAPGGNYYFTEIHHIILDGTSSYILSRAVGDAYDGKEPAAEKINFAELAEAERAAREGSEWSEAKAYYDILLGGCEPDCLPPRDRYDEIKRRGIVSIDFTLDEAAFKEKRRKCGISTTGFFNAVMGFVAARYGYTDESVIINGYSDRCEENADTIIHTVKMLPFVTNLAGKESVNDFLSEANAQLVSSREHAVYSLSDAYADHGIGATYEFVYQGRMHDYAMIDGHDGEVTRLYGPKTIEGADLLFEVSQKNEGYVLELSYHADKYSEGFAEYMAEAYIKAAKDFLKCERLSDIQLAGSRAEDIINKWNETDIPYDDTQTVVSLFEAAAGKHPENAAVLYNDKAITYRELEKRTRAIAAYIHGLGLSRGDVVSILIPRGEYQAVASLGALRAGCAYQPLDDTYPEERLNFMVSDAKAALLITTEELSAKINDYQGKRVMLSELDKLPDGDIPDIEKNKPDDLFILLYTSGSTGVPKGVMLLHKNLVCFIDWYRKFYKLSPEDRVGQYASYGFDACMMDMYPALCTGAAVCIIPEELRLDLAGMDGYMERVGVSLLFMTTQVGRQYALHCKNLHLRALSTGGEKLASMAAPGGFSFYNVYGPTECTIFSTYYEVGEKEDNIPIGRPLDNLKCYVVDAAGKLLPPGASGELWIAGPHVAGGYLNRPDKTKEVFIENPFDGGNYNALYRSGDVVRYRTDGNIEFIGRRDGQVKIRGFRIELSEVEAVIREYPGVKDATVAAFDHPVDGRFICAYVVGDTALDTDGIKGFIREKKPPYMVPAVIMQLDRIPLNQNSKVNKRALPKPELTQSETDAAASKRPVTKLEERLAKVVQDTAGITVGDVRVSLLELGLTSISAISLVAHFKDELSIDVPVKKILGGASLLDIENDIVEELFARKGNTSDETGVAEADRHPLTQSQFGIYSECMMEPDSTRYNISYCYELPKALRAERLHTALKKVIDIHPSLKCTIEPDEAGEVFMRPHNDREASVLTLSGSREECESYWRDFVKPFDFKKGLYDIAVFETDDAVFLMLDVSHIIFDGTSLGIFLEDLNNVLAGKDIAPESRSIFEYALHEKKALASKDFDEAKKYFDELMRGWSGGGRCTVPDPELDIKEEISGFEVIEREELSAASVAEWCKSHSVTPNAFFLAVTGIVLGKYTFTDDVCFTSIYNGRNDADIARSAGMFVKTFPVRCFPDGDTAVADFVEGVGKQILGNMSNDLYSFANISRSFGLSADFMLVYQGVSGGFGGDKIGGYEAAQPFAAARETQEDISIDVWEYDGHYRFDANYRANKYSREYIIRFIDVLATAALSMLSAERLSDIDITSGREIRLIRSFNETDHPVGMVSVNKLFEACAHTHPEMTAVIAGGKSLTYGELNGLSNALANSLIAKGSKTGDIIGLVMDRTSDVYIAEYGILKAGGAFLPMVKSYPDDRIDFCLKDAGCRYIITTEAIKKEREELFTEDKPYRCLTVEELTKNDDRNDPDLDIPADSLAYCIYTSGSTGRPKGVMIEHGNLCNFVNANQKNDETRLLVHKGEVMLAIAAVSFDVSIMESFIPLCNGMTACMAGEDEIHNPLMLCDLVEKNHVTVVCATPSFITNIADIPRVKEAFYGIKTYDLGAEAFPAALYDRLKHISPKACIINGYGPTEATISCIAKVMESGENITIGKPSANVKAYVMDKKQHILPVGVPGELVICGAGVGRGYVNLPEKTREAFITLDGRRAYRSGDLVRYTASGEIVFLGRLDNQVKLRGLRVELDEIENVINEYPGVLVSKVIVRNNGTEDYLAGFFTAADRVDLSSMTSFMKGKLTEYMIPAVIMQLDEMPLTVNGKIDKNALPDTTVKAGEREYTEPSGELETEFCQIFSDILSLPRVGALDNFFEIGGTSLSATRVIMQAINKGYDLVYKDVFEHPTPRELAAFIGGGIKVNAAEHKETSEAFDYSGINKVLAENIMEHADDVEETEPGNIILTGATGFLGIHILHEYLTLYKGTVYCLLRSKKDKSCEKRLKNMLMYYFDDPFEDYFGDRIICIEGDITDRDSLKAIRDIPADTVINCAACVKHFVKDDILDRVNVGGVNNLVDECAADGKRLVQISTASVAGQGDASEAVRLLHENELYFGQRLDNDYIRTKFLAERLVLSARADRGLDGMVIRVGNLMSRFSDGEFQINFVTNSFMRSLKAYRRLGLFPVNMMEAEAEFSPVDTTAQAILCLVASRSSFSVFHAYNDHILKMADVIYAMKDYGFDIEITDKASFAAALNKATKDESMTDTVLGLMAYDSGQGDELKEIGADNRFTANVLYRLGFKWCITDDDYLLNAVKALDTLGFFDRK